MQEIPQPLPKFQSTTATTAPDAPTQQDEFEENTLEYYPHLQQVPEEYLEKLHANIKYNYTQLNDVLRQYKIFSVLSTILRITPMTACLIVVVICSITIAMIPDGVQLLLRLFGFVIPLFLTWHSLYSIQPIQEPTKTHNDDENSEFESDYDEDGENDETNEGDAKPPQDDENSQIPDIQKIISHTNPQGKNKQFQIAQPNDPTYLFWAKYWLMYCISILADKMVRPLFVMWSPDSYATSASYQRYYFWSNINLLLIVLPPYFYSQLLYNCLLEPILLMYYDTIFATYQQTRAHLHTVANDTISTTTTAFRTISRHALVGGINSLTRQEQQQIQKGSRRK